MGAKTILKSEPWSKPHVGVIYYTALFRGLLGSFSVALTIAQVAPFAGSEDSMASACWPLKTDEKARPLHVLISLSIFGCSGRKTHSGAASSTSICREPECVSRSW